MPQHLSQSEINDGGTLVQCNYSWTDGFVHAAIQIVPRVPDCLSSSVYGLKGLLKADLIHVTTT
jgi:hypothetical protein